VNGIPDNIYSAASQYIQDIVYDHYNREPHNARFLTTNNMAFARERFLSIGGLDENFPFASEDRDLSDRWRFAGFPIIYDPGAVVYHFHALSLTKFWRQHFSYGRGAALFHRAVASRGSGKFAGHLDFHRHFPVWFRGAFRKWPLVRALQICGLLLVWQIANAAGFVYERLHS
jgi:GT2 family glycosyltransferase